MKNDEKKKIDIIGNIKASFSGRKFRSGAYTTAVSAIVIVMVLVVNLIVSKMDIQFDLSTTQMYTISQDTEDFVSGLTDDITIYYMIQQGNETEVFEKVVNQYVKLSDHITYEKKDPVLYPQFASKFVTDDVAENSFIVVNNTNGRAKYIEGSDMLVQEFNSSTYSYDTTGIDVEGELTSAIQYVTTAELPIMYVTEGHGEAAVGEAVSSSISKMNVEMQSLATLTSESIPEDCDMLFINCPQKDFSDDETTMLKDYLTNGGNAIIMVDYTASEFTNLLSIMDYFGIQMAGGIVLEGDANQYIAGYPNYIIPTTVTHDITTAAKSGDIPVFMPNSSGLTISDTTRSSLTVTGLLTTSDSSFARVNIESTSTEMEDGDIAGPFYVGLVGTDTYNDVTSNLVVFSSPYTFTDATSTYGNADLLTGTVGYLSGDMESISIPTKSLAGDYIYPSEGQALAWAAMTTIALPVAIFIIGAVICFRRRRK